MVMLVALEKPGNNLKNNKSIKGYKAAEQVLYSFFHGVQPLY